MRASDRRASADSLQSAVHVYSAYCRCRPSTDCRLHNRPVTFVPLTIFHCAHEDTIVFLLQAKNLPLLSFSAESAPDLPLRYSDFGDFTTLRVTVGRVITARAQNSYIYQLQVAILTTPLDSSCPPTQEDFNFSTERCLR